MRILFLVGGGLGNVVHAIPALLAMKQCGHTITLHLEEAWPNLAALVPHDNIVTGPPPDPAGFDRAFRSPFAFTGIYAGLAEQFAKTTEASALQFGPGSLVTEVESMMWFARVVGYDGLTPAPILVPFSFENKRGRYVLIAPGVQWKVAVWRKKEYPHWQEVASAIRSKIKVVWLGCKEDSQPWMKDLGENLCGQLNLVECMAVLDNAAAVMAPDNGLSCVSAALGVPTIVLWGPTDTVKNRKYGPHVTNIVTPMQCAPCQYTEELVSCVHANCMRSIPPAKVIDALAEYVPEVRA